MSSKIKIVFLFHRERGSLFDSYEKGIIPDTYFYGYTYFLKNKKYKASYVDGVQNKFYELIDIFFSRFFAIFFKLSFKMGTLLSNLKKIKKNDIIFCSADGVLIPALFLKKIGILGDFKIYGSSMGLINNIGKSRLKRYFIKKILKEATMIFVYSSKEKSNFDNLLKLDNVVFIRFGIDTNFFKYDKKKNHKDNIILSIGNDLERDFDLLIDCWREIERENKNEKSTLYLITNKKIKSNKCIFLKLIKSTDISIKEIRNLYENISFGIIPIKKTIRSSGQIAILSMLAMGKMVITNNESPGVFDIIKDMNSEERKFIINYKSGDKKSLKRAILEAIKIESSKNEIDLSERISRTIKEKYSTKAYYYNIKKYLA